MSFRVQKFAALCLVTAGIGLFGALAQVGPDEDPLSDLLDQMDTSEQTQTNSPDADAPDDSASDPFTSPDDFYGPSEPELPRIAPIFAPDYKPEDYAILPPGEDEDETDPFASTEEATNSDGEGSTDEELSEDGEPVGELDEIEYLTQPAVMLRGLDKITGRSTDIEVSVDDSVLFGGLRVSVKACHQTPPTEAPESIAYIEVEDYGFAVQEIEELPNEIDREKRVFHGWMFASSPGLNALEHPIYDVWVIRCMAEAPESSEAGSDL